MMISKRLSDKKYKKLKKESDIRNFKSFETRQLDDGDMIVEGYAATLEEETVIYEFDGIEYKEVIDRNAFVEADMSDVIFNYNHQGKVIARTRNDTLKLNIDQRGLHMEARVDGTEEGKKIFEEIQGGYIDRMSFRFSVSEDTYDRETRTRRILKIKKVWDVSAVDIPAYEGTKINARSYFDLEREKEELESLELRRRRLKLKLELGGIENDD